MQLDHKDVSDIISDDRLGPYSSFIKHSPTSSILHEFIYSILELPASGALQASLAPDRNTPYSLWIRG